LFTGVSLSPGTRIGRYEITALIGAGGMGEVYRATDTKLKRHVAIKVLPESLAGDSDRLARFQREAETLAALNHPNIAHIHGLEESDGVRGLVMELVEGPTLADRIAEGPVPVEEALAIAKQIAEALEAAHEQGIIHRDLKPANVKVRSDGTVKVLDFGLAKVLDPVPATMDVSDSPTITSPAVTQAGLILGTAAYMAPEQAKGKAVDKRVDIWAFGCVLCEMLTGNRPFDGEDVSDTLASVLKSEPDWSRLPATAPAAVQDIGDARIELNEALAFPEVEVAGAPPVHPGAERRARVAIAVIALAAGGLAGWVLTRANPTRSDAPIWRLSIVQPEGTVFTSDAPQISPDGRVVAFVATEATGRTLLHVRPIDSNGVRSLPDTDGASMPFWSPDSQSLGFFAQGQLKIVGLSGGDPQPLAPARVPRGGTWSRDGVILFASPLDLLSVSANGGTPTNLTTRQKLPGGRLFPSFLPDGRHYLYTTVRHGKGQAVHVGVLDSSESKELVATSSTAVYSAGGYLFFRRGTALMAQRFDHESRAMTGSPMTVAPSVAFNPFTSQALMSASNSGILIYFDTLTRSRLTVVDRSGKPLTVAGSAGYRQSLCLTGDETRVVYEEVDFASGNADLWALGLAREPAQRLTFDPSLDFFPVCPPDRGEDVVFTSLRTNLAQLFRVKLSEPGKEEQLSFAPVPRVPEHRSLDGRWLVYRTFGAGSDWDIWLMPLESPDRASAFAATAADERAARVSPDGRWIAYTVVDRGQSQIVLQTFPNPGATWQVSPDGGSQPQWRRDGKELFYIARDNKLLAIDIDTTESSPAHGAPRVLFDTDIASLDRGSYGAQYIVFNDGQRFVLNGRSDEAAPITVVLNWQAGLK
jgi:serine/threonine protein kinase/Tol biopolymer transport system component